MVSNHHVRAAFKLRNIRIRNAAICFYTYTLSTWEKRNKWESYVFVLELD